jgi:hypothetical protein
VTRDACGGRDNDKERAYGGPKVERQIFGIFLNCFVILFSFAGARGDRRQHGSRQTRQGA